MLTVLCRLELLLISVTSGRLCAVPVSVCGVGQRVVMGSECTPPSLVPATSTSEVRKREEIEELANETTP